MNERNNLERKCLKKRKCEEGKDNRTLAVMKRYVLKKRKNFNQIIIFDLINKKFTEFDILVGDTRVYLVHDSIDVYTIIYIHNNLLERISPSISGPTEGFVSANCQQRSGPISSASLITRNEFFSLL